MRPTVFAILFFGLIGQVRADEALAPKVLDRIKQATVFVRVNAGALSGTGSGFLVKTDVDAAYLVTNHHVVRPSATTERLARPPMLMGPGGRRTMLPPSRILTRVVTAEVAAVNVVFFSGTSKEKTVRAEVVGTDDVQDLALLKISKFSQLPAPLDLGKDAQPIETMSVYIIGFPFGELLSSTKGNPSITIGKGSVTGLPRNSKDELTHVQFDGSLNPGNSGGPVVDGQGQLVGIAVSHLVLGSSATGINKAIPALELTRLLNGRVGTPHLQVLTKDDKGLHVKVEFDLLDPSSKIKSVTLRHNPGDAPLDKNLAGNSSIPLKIEKNKAIGELVLPEPNKPTISLQTEWVRNDGSTDVAGVRKLRLPNLPPPNMNQTAQPGGPRPNLPSPKSPPPASQIAGLVGYWSFDDENVSKLADQSDKKLQARSEGINSVAGIRGKAINFTGQASFADLGDAAELNFRGHQPFSLSCWVKTAADSGTILAFRSSTDDGAVVSIFVKDKRLCATVRQDRAVSPAQLTGRTDINDGEWHHAALIRTGPIVTLYVDGQLQGGTSSKGLEEAITTDWRFLGREQRWLSQGQTTFGAMKGYFTGAIDEFCVFQRAINPDEVRKLAGR